MRRWAAAWQVPPANSQVAPWPPFLCSVPQALLILNRLRGRLPGETVPLNNWCPGFMKGFALCSCRLGSRTLPARSTARTSQHRRRLRQDEWTAAGNVASTATHHHLSCGAPAFPFGSSRSAGAVGTYSRRSSVLQPRHATIVCTAAAAATVAPAAASATPLATSLAVLVGWLVITGSCIRSLPQILRILRNNSVQGLSLTSFTSELFCYMIAVSYNFTHGYAFSTFGDTAICALQNVAIIGLIFRLGTVPRRVQLVLSAALVAAGWWLFGGACPPSMLTGLQAGSVLLLALGGRLPQILLNVQRGNSGELSLMSCALSLAGNLARVFTTAVLVRDPIILGSAGTQAILNGILTWQTVDTARRLGSGSEAVPAPQPT